ncbi:MAG: hypothetical protein AAGF90_14935 [Pseudomonadota bacterium]
MDEKQDREDLADRRGAEEDFVFDRLKGYLDDLSAEPLPSGLLSLLDKLEDAERRHGR